MLEVAGVRVDPRHWIAGERVDSATTFLDLSPIDGSELGDVARGGAAEVDAAVASARDAFPGWAALGPQGRAPILHRV
ncbi:MAG: aldehyde dehydrogenase family protein, partial [bacterium]